MNVHLKYLSFRKMKMKTKNKIKEKTKKCGAIMLLLAVLPCFFAVGVFAEEKGESLPQEYTAVVDRLPSELEDTLPEGIFSTDAEVFGDIGVDETWKATLSPRRGDGVWGCWNVTFEKGGERKTVGASDFQSAADFDSWQNSFSVWF